MISLRSGSNLALGNGLLKQSPRPTFLIAANGDSITESVAIPNVDNYLVVLNDDYDLGTHIPSFPRKGISGASWNYGSPTLTASAPSFVDPWLSVPSSGSPTWLIAFAGLNGMSTIGGNHSPSTELSDFEVYLSARLAAGWLAARIIVVTQLPSTIVSYANRAAYNSGLVSLASTYGYKLARVDLNTDIGQDGDEFNTTYYADGIHPTAAGHAVIATVIYAAYTS